MMTACRFGRQNIFTQTHVTVTDSYKLKGSMYGISIYLLTLIYNAYAKDIPTFTIHSRWIYQTLILWVIHKYKPVIQTYLYMQTTSISKLEEALQFQMNKSFLKKD